MEIFGKETYSNADGTADLTVASGSLVVPAESYADIAAVKAIANTAYIDLSGIADRRSCRVWLTMAAVGSDGNTSKEDIYLAFEYRATIGSVDTTRIRLQKLGHIDYTQGTVAITGGRTSHKFAKTAVWTATGLSAAIGAGQEIANAVTGQSPSGVMIYDVGPAIGIVRCPALGASSPSTGIAPMHHAWR